MVGYCGSTLDAWPEQSCVVGCARSIKEAQGSTVASRIKLKKKTDRSLIGTHE